MAAQLGAGAGFLAVGAVGAEVLALAAVEISRADTAQAIMQPKILDFIKRYNIETPEGENETMHLQSTKVNVVGVATRLVFSRREYRDCRAALRALPCDRRVYGSRRRMENAELSHAVHSSALARRIRELRGPVRAILRPRLQTPRPVPLVVECTSRAP